MKQGRVSSYNDEKMIGTISVSNDGAVTERYFFFGDRVVSGPEPRRGSTARFEVSSKMPKPDQMPLAILIHILDDNDDDGGTR